MQVTDIPQDDSSQEEWVPLTDAAKELGTSHTKLSRWAKQKRIKSKDNPYDLRQTLVDMNELKPIFKKK